MFFLCVQDMWFYLTEQEKFNDFSTESSLYWHETNIPYAVWTPESVRTKSLKYYPSEVKKKTKQNSHAFDFIEFTNLLCYFVSDSTE